MMTVLFQMVGYHLTLPAKKRSSSKIFPELLKSRVFPVNIPRVFYVVSTWNIRGAFAGLYLLLCVQKHNSVSTKEAKVSTMPVVQVNIWILLSVALLNTF